VNLYLNSHWWIFYKSKSSQIKSQYLWINRFSYFVEALWIGLEFYLKCNREYFLWFFNDNLKIGYDFENKMKIEIYILDIFWKV